MCAREAPGRRTGQTPPPATANVSRALAANPTSTPASERPPEQPPQRSSWTLRPFQPAHLADGGQQREQDGKVVVPGAAAGMEEAGGGHQEHGGRGADADAPPGRQVAQPGQCGGKDQHQGEPAAEDRKRAGREQQVVGAPGTAERRESSGWGRGNRGSPGRAGARRVRSAPPLATNWCSSWLRPRRMFRPQTSTRSRASTRATATPRPGAQALRFHLYAHG